MVVGDGSLLVQIKALADSLGIADKVTFTGFVDDVEHYMNCFDLNVNCSVGTETSSLALSEGMSIGLPAVASSYGGNPYMVRHGENGFIYSMGDFCELADMIRRFAQDSSLYEKASRAAHRRFLTELNAKNMTEQTEDFYFELYSQYLGNAQGIEC
jgi:glycosyltransferase involved in cell wall biosynthesis